jgi:molybdopterin biosynthesis enzyme
MEHPEIDEGAEYIGFKDARDLIMSHTNPSQFENRPVLSCAGYVSAEKVIALVDSPTNDISLKDGFAVQVQERLLQDRL